MTDPVHITLPGALFYGIASLAMLLLASWLVYLTLPKDDPKPNTLTLLRDGLGLSGLHPVLLIAGAFAYAIIAAILAVGLAFLILGTIALPFSEGMTAKELRDGFLFYVLRLAGLTTVLGAVIALPITVIRLRLTQKQTFISSETLLNEKINAATAGLYARHQVTEWSDGACHQVWQDDIMQRYTAIDRLEGLTHEHRSQTRRTLSLINGYIRQSAPKNSARQSPARWYAEISMGAQSDEQVHEIHGVWPNIADDDNVRDWLNKLAMREDLNLAMQVTGRLNKLSQASSIFADTLASLERLPPLQNDFSNLNLQAVRLEHGVMRSSNLSYSSIEAAKLSDFEFSHCKFDHSLMDSSEAIFIQFEDCRFNYVEWCLADWQRCQFHRGQIKSAKFYGCFLVKLRLHYTSLNYTDFLQSEMQEVYFKGCSLVKTKFSRCLLEQCAFENCPTLELADFEQTGFLNINLSQTTITQEQVDKCFGDASVILPESLVRPETWPDWMLGPSIGRMEYKKWRSSIHTFDYVPPSGPTHHS